VLKGKWDVVRATRDLIELPHGLKITLYRHVGMVLTMTDKLARRAFGLLNHGLSDDLLVKTGQAKNIVDQLRMHVANGHMSTVEIIWAEVVRNKHKVYGALLYKDLGMVMQVLEADVDEMFGRLATEMREKRVKDTRGKTVRQDHLGQRDYCPEVVLTS
jgi:hypothetical protein